MSSQQPYPRQRREGTPEQSRRRRGVNIALVAVAVVAAMGTVVGLFFGLLWAVNPVGDEWVCSDGEAPAGKPPGYSQCYDEDATLPPGLEWDPFGNRPMASNCDKGGWVQIERAMPGRRGRTERDCVREGTELPGRWELAED